MALAKLACGLLLLTTIAIAEGAAESREEHFDAIASTYVDESPGIKTGSLINCARFRIPGTSRMRNIRRAANLVHVSAKTVAAPGLQFSSPKIQVCFHGNSTLGLCRCGKDSWKSLEWSGSKSPFQTKYLDVRATGSITDIPVAVSSREDFCLYRVVFFVLGVALLMAAPVVSSWVPFYYSSAMTLGIFLVVLILLFQGMKLLPTGRKSSLYIIMYGSLIGLGTVLLRHIVSLLRPLMIELGLGEDMLKPVAVLFLTGIVILGAWLGYWGVRKFVLTREGEVDSGTSLFVKWSLRLFGVALLLQSSYDPLFGLVAVAMGGLISLMNYIPLPSLEDFEWPWFFRRSDDFDSSRYRRKYTRLWRRKQAGISSPGASSSYHTPSSVSGKRVFVSPPGRFKFTPEKDYYSTFHSTPDKKKMSHAHYDAVSRECTQMCMDELVNSPEFADWVVENSSRMNVLPDSSERLD